MKAIVFSLVFVVVLFVLAFIASRLFPIIQVCGDSMHPTYLDGEYVIGTKLYKKSKLKEGDVIVYRSPDNRIVIKRISEVSQKFLLSRTPLNKTETSYFCLGDNAECSHDSRAYGYISSKSVVCKVIDQRRKVSNGYDDNLCN